MRLREIKRTPWSLLSQESTVVDVADGVLTLAFRQPSLRDTFARRSDFQDNLRQAITDVLGVDLKLEAIVDPSADAGRRSEPAVTPPRPSQGGAASVAEPAPSSTVQPAGSASPSEAGASPANASDPSPSAPGRPAGGRRVGSDLPATTTTPAATPTPTTRIMPIRACRSASCSSERSAHV